MAHRMVVYVPQVYWQPDASSDAVEWSKTVLADTRREALEKCLPELRALLSTLPPVSSEQPSTRISVYVGETANPSAYASRLIPWQLDREGKIVGSLGWDAPRNAPRPPQF